METKQANQKDLIQLQSIIDLIAEYNKQDETADYIALSFRKKGRGISPEEINKILYVFSCVANCPLHELVGKSRKRPLPDYRKMVAFYLREKDVKLLDIAATLGWRDHSTVLSANDEHGKLYRYNKEYRKIYDNFTIKMHENGND